MSGNVKDQGAAPGLTAADLDRLAAIHPGLADSLARLRRARLCGYVGDRCDCKYAGAAEMYRAPDHRSETGGGCPEVRTAEWIVRALPSLLALARRGLEAEADPNFKRYVEASLRADRAETDLAAALAEVERVRGRLEKATEFVLDLPRHGPPLRVFATWDGKARRWWLSAYGPIQEAASLDAAWSAAEKAAQAQGGEGRA